MNAYIWVLIFLGWHSIVVDLHAIYATNGIITENVSFFYRTLPSMSVLRATIDYNVSTPVWTTNEARLFMGIHTTYPEEHIHRQCFYVNYGQLRNEHMFPYLRPGKYKTSYCGLSMKGNESTLDCSGTFTIQDYTPRNLSVSFGYECSGISQSLKGLTYRIGVLDESSKNNTCRNYSKSMHLCNGAYDHALLPNLFGGDINQLSNLLRIAEMVEPLHFKFGECYQHFLDFVCYISFPKCDPTTEQVLHPCREMCSDFDKACWSKVSKLASQLNRKNDRRNEVWSKLSVINTRNAGDCDYLPSRHGNINCTYKPVTCGSPPDVDNSTVILNNTQRDVYQLHDVIQYSCVNKTFQMEGNDSITCLYSGKWSPFTGKCQTTAKSELGLWLIALSVVLFISILFLIIVAIFNIYSRKQKHTLNELYKNDDTVEMDEVPVMLGETAPTQRHREFDAFVIYHCDGDTDRFITDRLLPNLEGEKNLTLIIHHRDFELGKKVEYNLNHAIDTSNNAIILLTGVFLQSQWCLDEFTHCCIEHVEDPGFKLFVAMMEPEKDLDKSKLPLNLKKLIKEQTYLERRDPDFFNKLADSLKREDDNTVRRH